MNYGELTLTFPDERTVGPGELQEWLEMVNECPELGEDERDLAAGIVQQIRVLSN